MVNCVVEIAKCALILTIGDEETICTHQSIEFLIEIVRISDRLRLFQPYIIRRTTHAYLSMAARSFKLFFWGSEFIDQNPLSEAGNPQPFSASLIFMTMCDCGEH
jgi:hypothetical protein